jgi:Fur family peroxide stress response transcriptional regulator
VNQTTADIRAMFARRGLRCTSQRVDVYLQLAGTKCHPTAEQLHRSVQERCPGTSLATVYNTLDALCAAGLARQIPTPSGVARYDADVSSHLHVVTDSGEVVDVPPDLGREMLASLSPDLRSRLEARLGTPVRHISVQFGDHASA